jgi:hypothetical protein
MLTCPICKQQFKKIDSQHLKKHSLTKDQYLELYPDGPLGASAETKLKLGQAVKSRSPMSDETKAKISEKLKNEPPVRTDAQRRASSKNALVAGQSNIGRKRNVTEQNKRNLSAALQAYYAENERPPYKDSARYSNQLEHLTELGAERKSENWDKITEEVPRLISSWAKDCNVFIDEQKIKVSATCCKCNGVVTRHLQTFKKHSWGPTICHTCHPPLNGTSEAEERINEFLIANGIHFQRHCKGILPGGLELDFYDGVRKIAIEYHGLYWHSGAMDYPKGKHRLKYELCRDRGIHLIQIFEDEWLQKQDIVKSRLLSLLGSGITLAYARQCIIESIPFKEASAFLNDYHLQGSGAGTKFNFALKKDGNVVAVMTFQQKRAAMNQKKEDGAVELVRFASSGRIPGAFSKLLKHVCKVMNIQKVYSWADLRWANPFKNVYLANGFAVYAESSVGYSYTDLTSRVHRLSRRKPAGTVMTEEQWNKELGFYQIFDAGTINFVCQVS